ncbi:hypothetical protein CM15mP35_03260 [bacterium]|nr:MAG: hypothetical protein CM15mP35_03260 [bacterium]
MPTIAIKNTKSPGLAIICSILLKSSFLFGYFSFFCEPGIKAVAPDLFEHTSKGIVAWQF